MTTMMTGHHIEGGTEDEDLSIAILNASHPFLTRLVVT